MLASATTASTEFSIDSATLGDQDFQRKLAQFIAQASDDQACVASNGLWKSSDEK